MESQYMHKSVCKQVIDMSFQNEGEQYFSALMWQASHPIQYDLQSFWNTSHYFIFAPTAPLHFL